MECTKSHHLRRPAQSWSLGDIREFCRKAFDSLSLDEETLRKLILAVDEAAANVVEHAYPAGAEKDVELTISIYSDHVEVQLRDTGILFNPVAVMQIRPPAAFSRRGYGIPLIRRIMDDMTYARSDTGENVLTLTKRFDTS